MGIVPLSWLALMWCRAHSQEVRVPPPLPNWLVELVRLHPIQPTTWHSSHQTKSGYLHITLQWLHTGYFCTGYVRMKLKFRYNNAMTRQVPCRLNRHIDQISTLSISTTKQNSSDSISATNTANSVMAVNTVVQLFSSKPILTCLNYVPVVSDEHHLVCKITQHTFMLLSVSSPDVAFGRWQMFDPVSRL